MHNLSSDSMRQCGNYIDSRIWRDSLVYIYIYYHIKILYIIFDIDWIAYDTEIFSYLPMYTGLHIYVCVYSASV